MAHHRRKVTMAVANQKLREMNMRDLLLPGLISPLIKFGTSCLGDGATHSRLSFPTSMNNQVSPPRHTHRPA